MRLKSFAFILGMVSLCASTASAALLTDYSTWTVDRKAPAGFANMGPYQGRSDVLKVDISAGDYDTASLGAYNNTQGRRHTLATPAGTLAVVYGSVYIPADWVYSDDTGGRYTVLSGFGTASGQGTCAPGSDSCTRYLNFAVTNTGGFGGIDPLPATPSVQFRTAAGISSAPGDPGMPAWQLHDGVALDSWNNVCTVLSADRLRHYANDALIRDTDISATPVTTKPDQISLITVNTQNRGSAYQVHWSNLGVGTLHAVGATSGDGQSVAVDTAFATPLSVQVLDTDGDPLPCVEVTFSAPATGASAGLSATTVLTDFTGSASISATANGVAGDYSVVATLPNAATRALALSNTAAASAVTPVPTLGEWAMIILTALLAGFGVMRLRRRH